MAAIYARAVRAGKRTLESVPEKWRAAVDELLTAEEAQETAETSKQRGAHFAK